MKALSPQARELFALLSTRPAAERPSLLRQIGALDELATLPPLAPYLFETCLEQAGAAAEVVDRLLRRLRPEQLPAIDERIRSQLDWSKLSSGILPSQVVLYAGRTGTGDLLLRILCSHRNGRVREEAVLRLGRKPGADALPWLLLRLSDYVLQVAHTARDAVLPRITAALLPQWIQHYALVLRIQTLVRGPRDIAVLVENLVRTQASPQDLMAGLDSRNPAVRRCFWHYLSATPGFTPERRLALLRRQSDVALRREVLDEARADLPPLEARALVDAFLDDPYPGLRRDALRILAERFPESAGERLKAALFDRGTAVRASARFHLKRRGELPDLAADYRAVVTGTQSVQLAVALDGLAETGSAADADCLLPLLAHPSPAIRKRVLHGLAKLAPGAHKEDFMLSLQDASPGVSKEARLLLQDSAAGLDAEQLWSLVTQAPWRHVQLGSLTLLGMASSWDALLFLLRARRSADEEIARLARSWLRRRLRSTSWGPVREDLARLIAEEISADNDGNEVLRFILRTAPRI